MARRRSDGGGLIEQKIQQSPTETGKNRRTMRIVPANVYICKINVRIRTCIYTYTYKYIRKRRRVHVHGVYVYTASRKLRNV